MTHAACPPHPLKMQLLRQCTVRTTRGHFPLVFEQKSKSLRVPWAANHPRKKEPHWALRALHCLPCHHYLETGPLDDGLPAIQTFSISGARCLAWTSVRGQTLSFGRRESLVTVLEFLRARFGGGFCRGCFWISPSAVYSCRVLDQFSRSKRIP